jgi:hypothetical protein
VHVVPPPSRPEATGGDDAPAAPLPLPLRNRLAELILEAFEPGEARATLSALAGACAADGSAVDVRDAGRLLALGWFESAGAGRVRLRAAHRSHGRTLADRAGRASSVTGQWRDRDADELTVLLDRAAALAGQHLFFEVHELLEPAWFRAAEPVRTALQGLIQIAVAFHHLENRNQEGARSLLVEGVGKIAQVGAALPLDAASWLGELRAFLAMLPSGRKPAGIPRWPRPGLPAPGRIP